MIRQLSNASQYSSFNKKANSAQNRKPMKILAELANEDNEIIQRKKNSYEVSESNKVDRRNNTDLKGDSFKHMSIKKNSSSFKQLSNTPSSKKARISFHLDGSGNNIHAKI